MKKQNPTSVMHVGKTSATNPTSLHIRELTQERNYMNVVILRKLLVSIHNLFYIREFTHKRIPMNAVNAGRSSLGETSLFPTRELIPD